MSLSSGNLCPLVKSRHPYVDRNLSALSTIIKNAIVNSFAFVSIAEEMRKARVEAVAMQTSEAVNPTEQAMNCKVAEMDDRSSNKLNILLGADDMPTSTKQSLDQIASVEKFQEEKKILELSLLEGTVMRELADNGVAASSKLIKDVIPTASAQLVKKPGCALGALFGNSSWRKRKPLKGKDSEQEKNENKVEQIKASVILPLYSFSSGENIPETSIPTEKNSVPPQIVQSPEQPSKTTTMEDVILLELKTMQVLLSRHPKTLKPSTAAMVMPARQKHTRLSPIFPLDFSSAPPNWYAKRIARKRMIGLRNSRHFRRSTMRPQEKLCYSAKKYARKLMTWLMEFFELLEVRRRVFCRAVVLTSEGRGGSNLGGGKHFLLSAAEALLTAADKSCFLLLYC